MTYKRKNKIIPLVLLLVLLAALIAGGVLLSRYKNREAEAEDTTVTVFEKSNAIATSLTCVRDGQELSFSYENEKWVYTGDLHFPLNSSAVSVMAEKLLKIEAEEEVDVEGADVKAFELDSPSLTVKAGYSDGSSAEFAFGTINSFNDLRYFSVSGSDKVYMVDKALGEAFEKDLKSLFQKEKSQLDTDGVESKNITSVVIETAGGQTNSITNPETVEKLYELISALDLSQWEDYYADEAEMADTYGIRKQGDRVTVNYTATPEPDENGNVQEIAQVREYTVYFGNEYTAETDGEEERGCFYSPVGSTVVYGADKETVDKIFEYLTFSEPVETDAEQ